MNSLTKEEVDQKALVLASELINFAISSWVEPENIKALLAHLGVRHSKHQMYFLTALSMLIRNRMVSGMFLNPESKENLVNAVQGVLDELIIRENEQEG